jgi:hypothetical protein
VDSFDSSNPLYSTNGRYIVTRRKANGNVGTDNLLMNSIHIGSTFVYGHVTTGYGTTKINADVGPIGSIGDIAWNASTKGIEPGYWTSNFVMAFPAVPAPVGGVAFPTNTTYNGTPSIVLNGGSYAGVDPGVPLVITGSNTVVWIQGSYAPSVNGITIVSNNNASLILYVGQTAGSGDTLKLSGLGSINAPGYAVNLQIYGLPSLSIIDFTGTSQFIGTIYAPMADIKGGGGGNNTLDTSGTMMARNITLNGKWNFHYDESLGQLAFPTFQ